MLTIYFCALHSLHSLQVASSENEKRNTSTRINAFERVQMTSFDVLFGIVSAVSQSVSLVCLALALAESGWMCAVLSFALIEIKCLFRANIWPIH